MKARPEFCCWIEDDSGVDIVDCPFWHCFRIWGRPKVIGVAKRCSANNGAELQNNFLLQIVGGLGEVGGAAEVAPVVLVGTEGEDFFALGGEAEVGGDDGKDALFPEHGEETGGDEVDAGEGEGVGIS